MFLGLNNPPSKDMFVRQIEYKDHPFGNLISLDHKEKPGDTQKPEIIFDPQKKIQCSAQRIMYHT